MEVYQQEEDEDTKKEERIFRYMEMLVKEMKKENAYALAEMKQEIEEIKFLKISSKTSSRSQTPTKQMENLANQFTTRKTFTPVKKVEEPSLEEMLENNLNIGKNKKNPKRETIFEEVASSEKKIRNIENKVFLHTADYERIKWRDPSLDGFLNFLEDIRDYEFEHADRIPKLYLRVSKKLKGHLAQTLAQIDPETYFDESECANASREDIVKAAKYEFCPRDRNDFLQILTGSCRKYKVDKVFQQYKITRVQLNSLKVKFLERLKFLIAACEMCSKEALIPALTLKEGGILKAFIDLTPEGTRKSFTTLLYQVERYSSIDQFMRSYFAIVNDNYESSEQLQIFRERNGDLVDINNYYANNTQNGNHFNKLNPNASRSRTFHAITNAVEESDEEDNFKQNVRSDEEQDTGEDIDQRIMAITYPQRDNLKVSSTSTNFEVNKNNQYDRKVPQDKMKGKDICHAFERTGACNKTNCKYSHDPRDIEIYREEVIKRLYTSRKSSVLVQNKSGDNNNNLRVVSTIGKPGRKKSKKLNIMQEGASGEESDSSVDESDESTDDEIAVIGGSGSSYLITELFKISEDTEGWRASHCPATVKLTDGRTITIKVVLFDSGADTDNYISTNCIQEHCLQQMLRSTNKKVKVANGEEIKIKSKITLDVTFQSQNGNFYTASITFLVLQGLPKDLVIGLPTIVKYFSELFKEMVDLASEKYQNEVLNNVESPMELINSISQEYLGNVLPWSKPMDPMAPEQEEIPDPDSFSGVFYFLEKSYEEASKEYLEMLPKTITSEFLEQTGVLGLLQTLGKEVFVPVEWTGINGIEPLRLEFKETLPQRLKPAARPIPKELMKSVREEIERLKGYFWEPSTSSITSPLVVAPKATKPFIRLCGDYRIINKHIVVFNYPIPNVIRELHKAANFKIFIDLDISNAFHNIRLSEESSRILSVQTTSGQFQPKFLPEGVAPASGHLMAVMFEIFQEYDEWLIVIFDNILVLAHDYHDAYEKLRVVLLKCKERNIYLKLSKCKFGIKEASFFGYLVNGEGYQLSDERKMSILKMPFPEAPQQTKKLQRFLGAVNYFKTFIPLFSSKTGRLSEMTQKNFNWDESTWKHNYRQVFEDFKIDILKAQMIYHPDYSLEWVLSVDASDFAVGGVLFQIPKEAKKELEFQVIAFTSKKLSTVAQRWSVIEKECFSVFHSVKKLSYYLYGKQFTIRTDHYNLLWMEMSEVPKIIRMRVYLQSFNFILKHIKGKDNIFADWLSRLEVPDIISLAAFMQVKNMEAEECDEFDSNEVVEQVVEELDMPKTVEEMLEMVHNARMGHVGARRTWLRLNKIFPGHRIPVKYVEEWVAECRWCQKLRLDMNDSIPPPIRKIDPDHARHFCGFDTLYVSPAADDGSRYINVVRLIPSGLVGLYPAKDLTANTVALALFQFFIYMVAILI